MVYVTYLHVYMQYSHSAWFLDGKISTLVYLQNALENA